MTSHIGVAPFNPGTGRRSPPLPVLGAFRPYRELRTGRLRLKRYLSPSASCPRAASRPLPRPCPPFPSHTLPLRTPDPAPHIPTRTPHPTPPNPSPPQPPPGPLQSRFPGGEGCDSCRGRRGRVRDRHAAAALRRHPPGRPLVLSVERGIHRQGRIRVQVQGVPGFVRGQRDGAGHRRPGRHTGACRHILQASMRATQRYLALSPARPNYPDPRPHSRPHANPNLDPHPAPPTASSPTSTSGAGASPSTSLPACPVRTTIRRRLPTRQASLPFSRSVPVKRSSTSAAASADPCAASPPARAPR